MTDMETLKLMTGYKAWANGATYSAVLGLPEAEAVKARASRFGNMVHTLNHIYVIDDIFRAHLLGERHPYTARNTESHPTLAELWQMQQEMDCWYADYVAGLDAALVDEMVHFKFVDGGEGAMTRGEIILHVVNHGTYHRGFVSDMLYQVPTSPPANDLPVYLRDVVRMGA